MRTERFDVVVLGGGNAGIAVTGPTRAAGMSVALVEARDLGGTCPNRGCTPKKVLVAAGHALHEIERANFHCISVSEPKLDWPALIAREKRLIEGIPERLEATLLKRGVDLIRGKGRFVSPNAVRVGDRLIEADNIVIATGSRARALGLAGAEFLKTSDDLLSATEVPDSIVFIGGGVISLEFAHVYARAGVKVTILEVLPQLLPALDGDAVALLQEQSQRIGIRIETGVRIGRIDRVQNRLQVTFTDDHGEKSVDADWVVNGAGRVANVDQLDLAAAAVHHAEGRIEVDAFLRSVSNPRVYVCGDVVPNSPQLSPIATYEGTVVGRNIVEGPVHQADYASVPNSVYTVPALASLGLTEKAARERGRRVTVHKTDMVEWLSARTYAEPAAWAKIIVDNSTDEIIGAHLVGHSGEELINVFALAMAHGITAGQIKEKIYAYPTFTSDIKNLL
jgi:glutathione reductase (NADPH)